VNDTTNIYTYHGNNKVVITTINSNTFLSGTDDLFYIHINQVNAISLNKPIWINIANIYEAPGSVGECILKIIYRKEKF
jgi:hypothetical protein